MSASEWNYKKPPTLSVLIITVGYYAQLTAFFHLKTCRADEEVLFSLWSFVFASRFDQMTAALSSWCSKEPTNTGQSSVVLTSKDSWAKNQSSLWCITHHKLVPSWLSYCTDIYRNHRLPKRSTVELKTCINQELPTSFFCQSCQNSPLRTSWNMSSLMSSCLHSCLHELLDDQSAFF